MHECGDRIDKLVEAHRRNFDRALAEVEGGRKRSDWMWYVFPQVAGLGSSGNATEYGIRSVEEARAFLVDEELGQNYSRIVDAVRRQFEEPSRRIKSVIPEPDDRKLVSSVTLFEHVARSLGLDDLAAQCAQIRTRARREGYRDCQATEDFILADEEGRLPEFLELLTALQDRRQSEKSREGRRSSWDRYYRRYTEAVQGLLGP